MEVITPPIPKSAVPRTRAALVRIGGLLLLVTLASLIGYRLGWFDYRHTLYHVDGLKRTHSVLAFFFAFVLIYAAGTAAGIPGLPFTVAAGALFGTVVGSLLAWIGAMLSAMAGYWIARTVGHDVVSRWLTRFRRVDWAIGRARDFRGMLLLRLVPVLPIGVVSFVGGLARARFGVYLGATAIGVLPSTLVYTYFADSLVEGVGHGRTDAIRSLAVASLLLIAITLAPKLLRSREASVLPPDGGTR